MPGQCENGDKSRKDDRKISHPFGTRQVRSMFPALKHRAIFRKSLRDKTKCARQKFISTDKPDLILDKNFPVNFHKL
jgi:hypothetical protein